MFYFGKLTFKFSKIEAFIINFFWSFSLVPSKCIRPSSLILFKGSMQRGYFCDWIIIYILSLGSRLGVKV